MEKYCGTASSVTFETAVSYSVRLTDTVKYYLISSSQSPSNSTALLFSSVACPLMLIRNSTKEIPAI